MTGPQPIPQLLINPIQQRLQEQLLQRHQQLQDGIHKQQQELNIIAEQLLLTSQLTVLTPGGAASATSHGIPTTAITAAAFPGQQLQTTPPIVTVQQQHSAPGKQQ